MTGRATEVEARHRRRVPGAVHQAALADHLVRVEQAVGAEADRWIGEFQPGAVASAFGWAWKPVVRRWITERSIRAISEAR